MKYCRNLFLIIFVNMCAITFVGAAQSLELSPHEQKQIYSHYIKKNHYQVIKVLDEMIKKNPKKAVYWVTRGGNNSALMNFSQTVSDYTEALLLCDIEQDKAYIGRILLYRAGAYAFLGNYWEAFCDISESTHFGNLDAQVALKKYK